MKRISIVLGMTLLLAIPASAINSVSFVTEQGTDSAWQLTNVDGTWQLSFVSGATVVNDSNPDDAVLPGDIVNLPTMTLTSIAVPVPGILTATLTPAESLTIQADTGTDGVSAGDTVFTASVAPGIFITAGTNFIAHSTMADDLDVLGFIDGYGTALPVVAAGDAAGLPVDLSFSGESMSNLFSILLGSDLGPTATGTVCGTITVIPAPGALVLVALGTTLVGWLRLKRSI